MMIKKVLITGLIACGVFVAQAQATGDDVSMIEEVVIVDEISISTNERVYIIADVESGALYESLPTQAQFAITEHVKKDVGLGTSKLGIRTRSAVM